MPSAVGYYVYRLYGGDRTGFGGGDTFLQNAHLFRQGRLITYRDEGRDVLLFVDNIYRYTLAGTEVSALLGRMPSG
jgi:hypothetical protein